MKKKFLILAVLTLPFLLEGCPSNNANPTLPLPGATPTSTPTNLYGFTSTPSYTPTHSLTPTPTNPAGYTSTPSSPTPTYTSTLSYTPTKTFTLTSTFTHTPTNTPTLTATNTPIPPSIDPILPQTASDSSGSPVYITLGAVDTYGNAVVFSILVQATHGSVFISGNTCAYTPPLSYLGVDTFTIKCTDTVTGAFSTEGVTFTDGT